MAMKPELVAKILAGPAPRLSELRPGDRLQGFENWGCVPDNATRVVRRTPEGELFVKCRAGRHFLDAQRADFWGPEHSEEHWDSLPGMILVTSGKESGDE